MRNKYILIFILLLAGAGTWYFLRNTTTGSTDKSKTMFAVDNIEDITKIFLSNKLHGNLLLEKKNGVWYVNGKHKVHKPMMDDFLNETIKKVRVAGPVPLAARKNVIASMASLATKVEIYVNGELEKVYYVGEPTNDMTGTYMYLQDSEDPFITHIPGFNGFLSTRYTVLENEWVNRILFDYKAEDIKSVDINYPADVNSSFTVTRKNNTGDFDISAAETAPNGSMNYAAVKSYFNAFSNRAAEGFIDLSPLQIDSIIKSEPVCIISITDKSNITHKLSVYRRASSDRDHGLYDNKGNKLAADPSRFNAIMDNEKRVIVIQDIVFANIMIKYTDFFLKQAGD